MNERNSYIYILTNYTNSVLYTGATGAELKVRVWQHKNKIVPGFTNKYNVTKLVYYEIFEDLESALNREAQIKAGSRMKKIKLIESINPKWLDLYNNL